ncbi:MAG: DnaB-like helicase C-terminal domain-containing protein [Pseudomonadales bacterium]
MNLVEHIALNQQKPVLVFSLEMPAESVTPRLLSSVGRIDQRVSAAANWNMMSEVNWA